MRNRNNTIDILRATALLTVISAHCGFPREYQNLRTFDVPMLIFLSGFSYCISSAETPLSLFRYLFKRFKKLIIPVWIFITFYLLFFFLIYRQNFPMTTIITSYAMTSGIGYVWIFRITFVVAIFNPLLKKIADKLSFKQSSLFIITLLILNELMNYYLFKTVEAEKIRAFLFIISTYNFGYMIISYCGIIWNKISIKERKILAVGGIIMLFGIGYFLSFPSIQEFKYPPQAYYIVYGTVLTMICYLIFDQIKCTDNIFVKVARWLSRNVTTIYLWHIFALGLIGDSSAPNYLLYFIFVMSISLGLTLIQNWIIMTWKLFYSSRNTSNI